MDTDDENSHQANAKVSATTSSAVADTAAANSGDAERAAPANTESSRSSRSSASGSPSAGGQAPEWQQHMKAQLQVLHQHQVSPYVRLHREYTALVGRYSDAIVENRGLKRTVADQNAQREATKEEMQTLKLAAQGLVLKSVREKELEERMSAMTMQLSNALEKTNRLMEVEEALRNLKSEKVQWVQQKTQIESKMEALQRDLSGREATNLLLKQENEALQMENAMQRDQFAKEKDENARLLPIVMKAKEKEMELQQQLMEVEQELTDLKQGRTSTMSRLEKGAKALFGLKSSNDDGDPGLEKAADTFADPMISHGVMRGCTTPSYQAWQVEGAHPSVIHTVTMSEDSKQIWTAGSEKVVRGFDSSNGRALSKLPCVASVVCLDTKGGILVGGCMDYACRVWDLATQRAKCQLNGHTEAVTASYLGTDVSTLYSTSRDCTIKSWDINRACLLQTSLCASSCYDLAVANDKIITAHFDNALRLWDIRTGKASGDIRDVHEKAVTSVRVAAGGSLCVSIGRDSTLQVTDLRMLKKLYSKRHSAFKISSNLTRLCLSPDGQYAAVGGDNGQLYFWNVNDGNENPVKILSKGCHSAAVMCVTWAEDGRGVASVGNDKKICFWR